MPRAKKVVAKPKVEEAPVAKPKVEESPVVKMVFEGKKVVKIGALKVVAGKKFYSCLCDDGCTYDIPEA